MIQEICFEDILLKSAKSVFETMIYMPVEPCPDCIAVEGDSLLGSITFTGNIEGCMAFCCDVDCANTIACNMLAADCEDQVSESEVRDAMGEIANMTMGSIKAMLIEQGISNVEVSIPCVVSGKELTSSLGEGAHEVAVPIYIEEEVAELMLQFRINN